MTDFNTTLETFINGCQRISDDHDAKWYPNAAASCKKVIEAAGGKKFLRIARNEYTHDGEKITGSVHCFVAVEDGSNRTMGSWKAGDVFKAAGWKAPARGVRGNIFDDNNGLGRMGEYGPAYNR